MRKTHTVTYEKLSEEILEGFFEKTRIERNDFAEDVLKFLTTEKNLIKMFMAVELGIQPLSAIVEELEDELLKKGHDIVSEKEGKKNKRNVGWMIKFVMQQFGYTTIGGTERYRIGAKSNSKYFISAHCYKKTNEKPTYTLKTTYKVVKCE